LREGRIQIKGAPIHYRIGGQGPVILLLHPSPSSGVSQLALANRLTEHFTVICPDTSGYGESPSFRATEYDMETYASRMHSFVKSMRINQLAIYGSGTGGQIAIRYGLMYPENVSHLFLDNVADFPKALQTEINDNYFPDLSPQKNGSHLMKVWEIATHRFKYFPWCSKTADHKLNIPKPPVAANHKVALDYLAAGEHYHRAYRSGFQHEKAAHVKELKVPATILRWEGSIVKNYTDILLKSKLPKNIEEQKVPTPAEDRYDAMQALIIAKYKSDKKYKEPDDTEMIDEYIENRKIRYKMFRTKAPFPQKDGSHLMEAWNKIKYQFPESHPKILQEKLVDWYAYSSII